MPLCRAVIRAFVGAAPAVGAGSPLHGLACVALDITEMHAQSLTVRVVPLPGPGVAVGNGDRRALLFCSRQALMRGCRRYGFRSTFAMMEGQPPCDGRVDHRAQAKSPHTVPLAGQNVHAMITDGFNRSIEPADLISVRPDEPVDLNGRRATRTFDAGNPVRP